MSVVRSSSSSQSVRLKITKNRRSESAFLNMDVTGITDVRRSGNFPRYPLIRGESREEKGGMFWVLQRPHVSSSDRQQRHRGMTRQIEETRKYLASFELQHITFASTGFRNHSDQWILRPSPTRDRLREWLTEVIRAPKSTAKPPTAKPSTASPSTASPSTPKPPTPNPQ